MENPIIDYLRNITNSTFVPFDKIEAKHFEPAFETCFSIARENLKNIINNTETPNFGNTIEKIEYCSQDLNTVTSIFNNLREAHTNPEINKIGEKILPQLAEWNNDIFLNDNLFEKVKTVFLAKPLLKSREQERLLEKTYKAFVRKGALLSKENKEKLRDTDQQLALLSQKFSHNLLEATNKYKLVISEKEKLAGLPEYVIEAAKLEAEKEGKPEAWIFTLKQPSIGPFLKYADHADLRKELAIASGSKAMSGEFDNRPVVLEIVALRDKRAQLLGYKSHAHYILEDRMAKNPKTLCNFFEKLHSASYKYAKKEVIELQEYKKKLTGDSVINPWDIAYFSEKLLKEKFNFSEEELKPYFSVPEVMKGIFEHVKRLYGISAHEKSDIPIYYKDLKVYEIKDAQENYLGTVYFDLFPRDSKRAGGWIDALRLQQIKNGVDIRPHLLIVCNLTKPTPNTPGFLSVFEAETIFHEFGHALHNLFSQCTYPSLSGFNTTWDFVELPSQLMDSFLDESESMKIVGKHFKTGESIPDQLIERRVASQKFHAGWIMLSQLGAAVLDMKWHDGSARGADDVETFERKTREGYLLVPLYPGTSHTTSFKHIFDGGYDVGYYSYHWSEVLAADAFDYFKENGLFSTDVALKFRQEILSKGDTEDAAILYRNFRGRDADPSILLKKKGLE